MTTKYYVFFHPDFIDYDLFEIPHNLVSGKAHHQLYFHHVDDAKAFAQGKMAQMETHYRSLSNRIHENLPKASAYKRAMPTP